MKIIRISCVFGGFLSLVLSLSAQTLTTLHSFDGKDGGYPRAGLVQATNGDIYGTTSYDCGTVFKITPTGTLTTLLIFKKEDGCNPQAGLVQATDGSLYGTTLDFAVCNDGTVFKITPSGKLTTLHSFCGSDGAYSYAGLVQDAAGNLYGTTEEGGSYEYYGTVFNITPSGTVTTLYSFGNGTDGANPYAGLVQATDGNFYGTTYQGGGANNAGTVFKITPSGTFTTLYSFCSISGCNDGAFPYAALVQATDGNLYGTTVVGGPNGIGTVFKITLSGQLTTLHSFDEGDGAYPYAGLVQATDGNLYGTTESGGSLGDGTVFKITPSGKLTTLHRFDVGDGANPNAGLVQYTDGKLYGTTQNGGVHGLGTVFSLSVGLGPFVETQPTSGKVGAAVKILGTDLTGASRVTFNGTAARFTVVSKSEIKTTVPAGATTGTVEVTTPKGTLKSNVVFRVS
jgi:uncharacterized repeat protein (TIGR03803 family)